jgi:hypothetical protein
MTARGWLLKVLRLKTPLAKTGVYVEKFLEDEIAAIDAAVHAAAPVVVLDAVVADAVSEHAVPANAVPGSPMPERAPLGNSLSAVWTAPSSDTGRHCRSSIASEK